MLFEKKFEIISSLISKGGMSGIFLLFKNRFITFQ